MKPREWFDHLMESGKDQGLTAWGLWTFVWVGMTDYWLVAADVDAAAYVADAAADAADAYADAAAADAEAMYWVDASSIRDIEVELCDVPQE